MDKEQLTQEIIDEMQAQSILGDLTDEKTGKVLFEIQFADETLVCEVGNIHKEDL